MKRSFLIMCLTATALFPVFGNTVVVLSNGDRLKGAVVREEGATIHFRSDVLGELTLKKNQVKQIIRPAAQNAPAPAKPAAEKAPAPKPPPAKAAKAAPKKPKRWSGNVGVALNTQHAEYERRTGAGLRRQERDTDYLRLTARVGWDRDEHHLDWNVSYVYSLLNERKNNDLYSLSQQYRYDLTDRWFGQSETSYEHDYLRVLSAELEQFTGIGWVAVTEPTFNLELVPGVSYYYRDQADERTEGVVPGFQQNLTSKVSKQLTLFQGFNYSGFSDQYYYAFNAGLDNRLVKNLFLRLEYKYEVDAYVDEGNDPFIQRQLISSIHYRF